MRKGWARMRQIWYLIVSVVAAAAAAAAARQVRSCFIIHGVTVRVLDVVTFLLSTWKSVLGVGGFASIRPTCF